MQDAAIIARIRRSYQMVNALHAGSSDGSPRMQPTGSVGSAIIQILPARED
jgi:hypothetical protein